MEKHMNEHNTDVVEKLIAWGRATPAVRAMILTSTRANPDAHVDPFSDYDVILAVTDIYPFCKDESWLETFGRTLVLYRDPIELENGYERFFRVVQYEENRLKIDFAVRPMELVRSFARELPAELDVGYRVLLDKDGITADFKPPTYRAFIPSPPTASEFQTLIENFFHEATYTAKHLWRGDIVAAKESLDTAMKFRNLRCMLEWRVEVEHSWSIKLGAYGRGLEKLLSPNHRRKLEATYVGYGISENWLAFFPRLTYFAKLRSKLLLLCISLIRHIFMSVS